MNEEIKNKIHDLAVKQIIEDFELIKEKTKNETLYGYAIGIVGDITGFFSAGNTVESLNRTLIRYEEKDFHPSSFWCIPEWEYSGIGDNEVSTFINGIKDEEYDSTMKDYENTLIRALKTCENKGVFGIGKERENLVIYLQYADATDEDIDDISSEQINPKNIHLLFKERWNDKANSLTKIITEKVKTLPNRI